MPSSASHILLIMRTLRPKLLDTVRLSVQAGTMSINEARAIVLEDLFAEQLGTDPWVTASALWFIALLLYGVALGLGIEVLLAWR